MAGVGLETGRRKGLAHCQVAAIFRVLCPFEDACLAIGNAVKQWVGIVRGSGGYVQVKPSEGTQTKLGLFGYIHKMPIAAKLWNVSPDELTAAKDEYELVRTDPLAGKRQLNKSNFVKELFAFGHTQFAGNVPEVDICALQAIRSGEYAPTSTWLVGSGGAGLNLARAKIFWRLAQQPETCTLGDIHTIFFFNPYAKHTEAQPMPSHIPSYEELRAASRQAQKANTEHHYSANNVVLEDGSESSGDSEAEPTDLAAMPGPHHYHTNSGADDEPEDDVEGPVRAPPRSEFIASLATVAGEDDDESDDELSD